MTYMSSYVPDDGETGLGIAPALIGAGVGLISSLFGNAHPKDKIRFQRNVWLYNDAQAGHKGDLYQLGVMSSKLIAPEDYDFGPLPDGWTGHMPKGAKGGWATGSTQDDAYKKYQAAKYLLERSGWQFDSTGRLVAVGPPPPPPPLVTPQAGSAPPPATTPASTVQPALAGLGGGSTLGMLAVGGILLYALSQAGRS